MVASEVMAAQPSLRYLRLQARERAEIWEVKVDSHVGPGGRKLAKLTESQSQHVLTNHGLAASQCLDLFW